MSIASNELPEGEFEHVPAIKGIAFGLCPKCRSHKMFRFGVFNLPQMFSMHKVCPHCGQSLEPEPGFYYGAMYVSYSINVAMVVTGLVAFLTLWPEGNPLYLIAVLLTVNLLSVPINFRISRILWVYAFAQIKYDRKKGRLKKRA